MAPAPFFKSHAHLAYIRFITVVFHFITFFINSNPTVPISSHPFKMDSKSTKQVIKRKQRKANRNSKSIHTSSKPTIKSTTAHITTFSQPFNQSPIHFSRRFLKLNLTSINTQQPAAPKTTKTTTIKQHESEDDLSEDEQPAPVVPPVATDLIITPAAIKQLKHLNKNVTAPDPPFGLRVTVDTGGCSGFQYIYNKVPLPADAPQGVLDALAHLATEAQATSDPTEVTDQMLIPADQDLFFVRQQQFLVTDDVSMTFLKGSKLDYKTELIRSGFAVVGNPNVDLACGCGTSFSRKEKEKEKDKTAV
jgi:Fe-S cluster assembly iron-binding protein IscA